VTNLKYLVDKLNRMLFGSKKEKFIKEPVDSNQLQLSSEEMNADGNIQASVTLKNTGDVEGKEIVQLYLRDLVASTTRPVKELKGFEAVSLAPGVTKTITFNIDEELLQFYNANRKWESEEGEFEVFIGGNSNDLKKASFTLKK